MSWYAPTHPFFMKNALFLPMDSLRMLLAILPDSFSKLAGFLTTLIHLITHVFRNLLPIVKHYRLRFSRSFHDLQRIVERIGIHLVCPQLQSVTLNLHSLIVTAGKSIFIKALIKHYLVVLR